MIENLNHLHQLTAHLSNGTACGATGQVEAKVKLDSFHTEVDRDREIAFWKGEAEPIGWEVEKESHEIEGRHMLTMTWRF